MAQKLVGRMAEEYQIDADVLLGILRNTAFKQGTKSKPQPELTDPELAAALHVCEIHELDPFTKEIYAIRDQRGGLLIIISIDGWSKIINRNEMFNGMKFVDTWDDKTGKIHSITCTIFRKDRDHPTEITEYFKECERKTEPWERWPARMLRHKSVIQCGRLAFALERKTKALDNEVVAVRIVDQDEAKDIIRQEDEETRQLPAPTRTGPAFVDPVQVPAEKVPVESPVETRIPPLQPAPIDQEDLARRDDYWQVWIDNRGKLSAEQLTDIKVASGVGMINPQCTLAELEKVAIAISKVLKL